MNSTNHPFFNKHEFMGKWFGAGKKSGDENSDGEIKERDIDYELKKENGEDDVENQSSDFEDFHGVERRGKKDESCTSSDENDDDDDEEGGEMMPVVDI